MSTKAARARTGKLWMIPTSLIHSAGAIIATMNGSLYSITLPALSANTLYYIYFVANSGLTLSISTNPPSNFSDGRILVGAFYSTGDVAPVWGSFVNIDGVPNSEPFYGGLAALTSNNTAITKAGGTTEDRVFYTRFGKQVKIEFSHSKNGSGGTAAAGNWNYNTAVFPADSAKIPGLSQEDTANGIASVTTPTDGRSLVVFWNFNDFWNFRYTTPSNVVVSSTTHPYNPATWRMGGSWTYPVAAWSNTALKDL